MYLILITILFIFIYFIIYKQAIDRFMQYTGDLRDFDNYFGLLIQKFNPK